MQPTSEEQATANMQVLQRLRVRLTTHPHVRKLAARLHFDESIGFVRMMNLSDCVESDAWVPLEVHFGMPLFESCLNDACCAAISRLGLFDTANLEKHRFYNRELCVGLLSFIEEVCLVNTDEAGLGERVPPPTSLVTFKNGVITASPKLW
mmetsp:Transcript_39796/g.100327  ORF Transcript_39796/g.100327 Transcript_39796/m.100327 type:complete len:151 (-) Transcript_39796:51-503(-)